MVLISALAAATEHLGLVATSSVQTEHPFVHARRFSTLDHITRGRVGWNIVTSTRRSEARNLGLDDAAPHAERYAAAEEYAEVVYKLWERSWADGAVIRDRAAGRYSDETKVHAIDHEGPGYRVAGPHLAEPSPQRTPVLFQAGSSETGRTFAARHAEGTFIAAHDPHSAAEVTADIRRRAVAQGRRPDDILFIQGLTFVVGATDDEAKRKSAEIDEWLSDEAMLAHMSGTIGVDGVNVIYITLPGTYADFIDHVAPVLQERGLMQREYRPGTLREKLFPGRGPQLPESHPARQVRIPADSENPVR